MLFPMNGNRSSRLLKNSAFPPRGNPVGGDDGPPGVVGVPISLGPAANSGKPRFVKLPPAKKRSGNGIASCELKPAGTLYGKMTPKIVCRAKTKLPLNV